MSGPFPPRQWSLPRIAWEIAPMADDDEHWEPTVSCCECGKQLDRYDFIQKQLARFVPKGEQAKFKHECCDDPTGAVAWGVAHQDAIDNDGRGHKSQVNTYHWEHRR